MCVCGSDGVQSVGVDAGVGVGVGAGVGVGVGVAVLAGTVCVCGGVWRQPAEMVSVAVREGSASITWDDDLYQ